MPRNKFLAVLALMLMLSLVLVGGAFAQAQFKVLYTFAGGSDGYAEDVGLTMDGAGNLYGLEINGSIVAGAVFKLTPDSLGNWSKSVLYTFSGGADGDLPYSTLVFDSAGNLYGTTNYGGDLTCLPPAGCGVVYKLAPNLDGSWSQSVLYTFPSLAFPAGSLVLDPTGSLYGVTAVGGDGNFGAVFKLTPNADGTWSYAVIYNFTASEGANPVAAPVFDAAGNLYGTTQAGGNLQECFGYGCGVVYKLTPMSDGTWSESVLHTFTGDSDGSGPDAAVTFDATGNLYSTTDQGGNHHCTPPSGCGVAFELTPNPDGSWTEHVLHQFGRTNDGSSTRDSLIPDHKGNFYSTAYFGGAFGVGNVFKLQRNAAGSWREYILHQFTGGSDGSHPGGNLVLDAAGNLYGVSSAVVYEITH